VQGEAPPSLYFPDVHFRFDLSLTDNPLGASSRVVKVAIEQDVAASYPPQGYPELRLELSRKMHVNPNNIILGAGIDGLLSAIATAFLRPGDEVVMPRTTFPKIAHFAHYREARVSRIPMTADLRLDFARLHQEIGPDTRIIYLCNPNNPTGLVECACAIADYARCAPCLVIVDEANVEFCSETCIPHLSALPNLLVLRTFSKAYGLASARVGYAVGAEDILDRIARSSPRFPISSLSAEMARMALADEGHVQDTRALVREQSAVLQGALRDRGFLVISADTNCFVSRVPPSVPSAKDLLSFCNGRGVSFVTGEPFGLSPEWLRVAPRTYETNRALVAAIDAWLKS